jgi:hypothetical protein
MCNDKLDTINTRANILNGNLKIDGNKQKEKILKTVSEQTYYQF